MIKVDYCPVCKSWEYNCGHQRQREKEVDTILVLAYEVGMIKPVADGNTEDCNYCGGSGQLVRIPCPFCGGDNGR